MRQLQHPFINSPLVTPVRDFSFCLSISRFKARVRPRRLPARGKHAEVLFVDGHTAVVICLLALPCHASAASGQHLSHYVNISENYTLTL
jgi:hypothetical protein